VPGPKSKDRAYPRLGGHGAICYDFEVLPEDSGNRGEASLLHLSKNLTSGAALGLIALALGGCSVDQNGPQCKVGAAGIADAPMTGASLDDQYVALVVDGGPTQVTPDAGTYLAAHNIGAAFFAQGKRLDHPAVLSSLRDQGHLIGNGTFSGSRLDRSPLPAGELRSTDALITPYIVGDMFFFDSPGDQMSHALAGYLNRQGLAKYVGPVGADVAETGGGGIDAGCWRDGVSPATCSQRYLQALADKRKGIIRFTDGATELVPLLQELVPALQSAGFQIVRLDDVPAIHSAFVLRGAETDVIGGAAGCSDYGK
jgi:peptidoglycan/xylan/chitin deacetylase (PgdA/CDA1 family)